MFQSKYGKVFVLIVGLLILSAIGFYCFNHQKTNVQTEPLNNDNSIQQEDIVKKAPIKKEALNPIQKYYKDNLEQAEIQFLKKAKTSKNNDLEFSKLQTKFIKATDVLNEKYTQNIDPDDTYYRNNWVKLPCVEGIYFYAVNTDYLLKKFGKYLSPSYNEWLKFIVKKETVMQDGGLIVPPDKLREYIIFIEKFVEQNPNFILIGEAKKILNSYLITYLVGVDNSPIFDKWNTRKMKPEFKESYEKFLSENKDSKYYPMVEELYNKSKENDFNWDRDFDQWLYSYHKKYFS